MNRPTKVIAGALGLSAFAMAVVAGMAAGNSSPDILLRALGAMIVCYVVGVVLGMIGERTVEEHVRSYIESRAVPVPPSAAAVAPDTGGKDGGKLGVSSAAG